jgi:hypothetical protein
MGNDYNANAVAARGNYATQALPGVAGAGVGPYGNAAARDAASAGMRPGYNYVSPSGQYANAAAVRNNFNSYNMYNQDWYNAHPGAWYAAGWASGSAWTAATWPSVGTWFGYGAYAQPVSYDYGSSVVYQGDNVYVNGQDAGTSSEYYQQAQTLASAGAQAQPAADDEWMALGVFAVSQSGQNTAFATLQLAVDKSGTIRGNYTDNGSNQTQQVQGSVDKKTQRVAFTVGGNSNTVVEVGLYNLTQDEATALVHNGSDSTQQWQLVRIQQSSQSGAQNMATQQ